MDRGLIAMRTNRERTEFARDVPLASIAQKSLEIFERCRLWQRNLRLRRYFPLLFGIGVARKNHAKAEATSSLRARKLSIKQALRARLRA